jgi:hypothetical protein
MVKPEQIESDLLVLSWAGVPDLPYIREMVVTLEDAAETERLFSAFGIATNQDYGEMNWMAEILGIAHHNIEITNGTVSPAPLGGETNG